MKLVITEKPSVAQSIAKVIGATKRCDGYLEGPCSSDGSVFMADKSGAENGYLVSWCVGHLIELEEPQAYDPKYERWKKEDLPILPEDWKYRISASTRKQFETLQKLMQRKDVTCIVNACDAGREGELIFRLVYQAAGCTKPFERLWISSMEDDAIREGFKNLKPSREYDALYEAALCRERADWIVGINATRLFSCLYGQTLNVGRVVTPTLAMAVMRESEIRAFKPQEFYTVQLQMDGFNASTSRLKTREEAEQILERCNMRKVMQIVSIERKDKYENPPKLFDLTSLQREANEQLGYTAQQTLDYVQSLYEKKLVTYPRTDSRYLTDDMENSLSELLRSTAGVMRRAEEGKTEIKQVLDSSKVSDHHAIIPTKMIARSNLGALPEGESRILRLIADRLLAAVGEPARASETTVHLSNGTDVFQAKGKEMIAPGWKKYGFKEKKEGPSNVIPILQEGQSLPIRNAEIKTGTTTPPSRFTESALLSSMERADGREEKAADEKGTEEIKDAEENGAKEMEAADKNGTGIKRPENAAARGHQLPDKNGTRTNIKGENDSGYQPERSGIGTPATRAGIIEKLVSRGFLERTGKKKTKFLVPTEKGMALITVMPENIQSPSMTADWEEKLSKIEHGEYDPKVFMQEIDEMISGLVATYHAAEGAEYLMPRKNEIGKCPHCGSSVVETTGAWRCVNRNCRFAIWRNNHFFSSIGKYPDTQTVKYLLKYGGVELRGCHSARTGKNYNCTLLLRTAEDGKAQYYLQFKGREF